jgi:hypothetical protein
MALSGPMLLALYLTVMAVLIGGFFFLRKKFQTDHQPAAAAGAGAGPNAAAGGRAAGAAPARRGALDRMRRGNAAAEEQKGDADNHEDGEGGDDEDVGPLDAKARRAAEKAAAKAAREQVRAQQEQAEAHKRAKDDKYTAKREAREAEREAAEAEARAESHRKAEDQKQKDEQEFDEWKDLFTVQDAGTAAAEDDTESQEQLEEFVRTIKTRKVVPLDELAVQYKIKTPDVIARIQAMEAAGRLTGVLDDRGKFLSITPDEMDAVSAWIKKRGRVTIAELVAESNKLIDLNGTAEEVNEKLVLEEDEAKSA